MSICQKTEDGYKILASSNGTVINGAELEHYSTEERIIGYWTDGKPIYRKVVTFTATQKATAQTVNLSTLGVTNVDKLLRQQGLIGRSAIPKYYSLDDGWNVAINVDNSIIWYKLGEYWTVPTQITVCIEYTKTTDTPVTNNNTYSTDEVITGKTWIDGKPIYRKVVAVSSFTVDNVLRKVTIVDKSTLNINKIIDMHARGLWNGTEFNFPYCNVVKNNLDDVTITVTMQVDGDNVVFTTFRNVGSTNVTDVYAILEYTKTTD